MTMVERKSLYTIIDAVARKTATAVRRVIVAGLTPHKSRVYTLTYDNSPVECTPQTGHVGTEIDTCHELRYLLGTEHLKEVESLKMP